MESVRKLHHSIDAYSHTKMLNFADADAWAQDRAGPSSAMLLFVNKFAQEFLLPGLGEAMTSYKKYVPKT